jgi:hypothetical protein
MGGTCDPCDGRLSWYSKVLEPRSATACTPLEHTPVSLQTNQLNPSHAEKETKDKDTWDTHNAAPPRDTSYIESGDKMMRDESLKYTPHAPFDSRYPKPYFSE